VPLENVEISERIGGYTSFIILAHAHFCHDIPCVSSLDLPIACRPRPREPGSAPPIRCASEICAKRLKLTSADRLLWIRLSRPWHDWRSAGHHQARNGPCLESCRIYDHRSPCGYEEPGPSLSSFTPIPPVIKGFRISMLK
jgi:hypothetical protein